MKYNYRDKQGKFITKEKAIKKQLHILIACIVLPIVFGTASHYAQENMKPIHVFNEVEASEWTPQIDICHLDFVTCPNEDTTIEKKIKEIPHESPITTERIRTVYEKSQAEGVDGDVMMHIAWCESELWNKQSESRYTFDSPKRGIKKGEQERSYGWFMIHEPDHKIPASKSLDINFAVDWAIQQVKNGNYPWFGYDSVNDSCRNSVVEYWK